MCADTPPTGFPGLAWKHLVSKYGQLAEPQHLLFLPFHPKQASSEATVSENDGGWQLRHLAQVAQVDNKSCHHTSPAGALMDPGT